MPAKIDLKMASYTGETNRMLYILIMIPIELITVLWSTIYSPSSDGFWKGEIIEFGNSDSGQIA